MHAADSAMGSSAEGVNMLKRRVEVLAYRYKGDWDAFFASFGSGDEARHPSTRGGGGGCRLVPRGWCFCPKLTWRWGFPHNPLEILATDVGWGFQEGCAL